MKTPDFRAIPRTVLDRRLYGSTFFMLCTPLLVLSLGFQFYVTLLLNQQMLAVYVPSAIVFVLFSAAPAKNLAREFYCIGYRLGFLFLIASILAETATFVIHYSAAAYGAIQLLIVFCVSLAALLVSTMHVTVWGQRVSLRKSARLTDDFFKRQKEEWKKRLHEFPNSENIINSLENGQFVADLFDRGSFDLVVLWSCSVMEKVVDAAVEGILAEDPKAENLFRKDKSRRRYPIQLKHLGFRHSQKYGSEGEKEIELLWSKTRNDVAHGTYKPTFDETYQTLAILVTFVEKMPDTLAKRSYRELPLPRLL